MKTSIRRIGKSTISVLLAVMMIFSLLTVGIVTADAYNVGGYIYFDNTNTDWSNVQIFVGHGSFSRVSNMTQISGTNLYYFQLSKWTDATEIAFVTGCSGWGEENNSVTHRLGYVDYNKCTYAYSFYSDLNESKYHLFSAGDLNTKDKKWSFAGVTSNQSSYTFLNGKSLSAGMKVSTNGTNGTYSNSTDTSIASVAIKSGKYNSKNSISASTTEYSASASWNDAGTAVNSSLSYQISNTDYNFKGWYDSNGNQIDSSATYSFDVFDNGSYFAYFYKDPEPHNITKGTVSHGSISINKTTATEGTTVTVTPTANTGYVCTGVKYNGSNATKSGNNYTFSMPDEDVTVTATFEEIVYYVEGRFHVKKNGSWVNSFDSSDWASESTNIPFTKVSNTEYVLNTGATLGELSNKLSNSDPYFYIRAGVASAANSTSYYPSGNKEFTGTSGKVILNGSSGSNVIFKVTGSNASLGPVTIKFNPSTKELSYSVPDPIAISKTSPSNGSITVPSTAYPGDTVTVTLTPTNSNYKVNSFGVTETSSGNTVTVSALSDSNTFTFVMPSVPVTVAATFAQKLQCTVKAIAGDTSLGRVKVDSLTLGSTSEKTVSEGTNVTITATPNSGKMFNHWAISGSYDIVTGTLSSASLTIKPKSNVTATAAFSDVVYRLYYNSSTTAMRETNDPGVYISTVTVAQAGTFYIVNSDNKYSNPTSSGNYWLNGTSKCSVTNWASSSSSANAIYNNAGAAKYVVYDSVNKVVYFTSDPDNKKTFTVFAKDGTVRAGETTTDTYADTVVDLTNSSSTVTAISSPISGHDGGYTTYSALEGSMVAVKTTMANTTENPYRDMGYYVVGYSINGKYYKANVINEDQGIYGLNLKLEKSEASGDYFEITPIYLNKNIEANGDYITFYVDPEEKLVANWGNSIAVYDYYYKNGTNRNDTKNLFRGYPGSPMAMKDGYFAIKISKYYYGWNSSSKKFVKDTSYPISGMTLSNFNGDDLHFYIATGSTDFNGSSMDNNWNGKWNSTNNLQTYDFNDFAVLASKDVEAIMFKTRFYDNDDTTAKYHCNLTSTKLNSLQTLSTYNPFVRFENYYGDAVDITGALLSNQSKDRTDVGLYIVSVGNQVTVGTNYTTKGEWSTFWYVYDASSKALVTSGTPADFLKEGTTQYNAVRANNKYKDKLVMISFDKEKTYDEKDNETGNANRKGSTASRSDGQWFYSENGYSFTSTVSVKYRNIGQSDYTAESNQNSSVNKGFYGSVTGTRATLDGVTTAEYMTTSGTGSLKVVVGDGYQFDGWYIKSKSGEEKFLSRDINYTMDMNNSYEIIAYVSQIPVGTLLLSHDRYTGDNPPCNEGAGDYYISTTLLDQYGNLKRSYNEYTDDIKLNIEKTDTIEVTLHAKAHGRNYVYAVYEAEGGNYFEIGPEDGSDLRKLNEYSFSFTIDCSKLFKGDSLKVKALRYYTDMVLVGGTCKITYRYVDRKNMDRWDPDIAKDDIVTYTKTVKLSDAEIQNDYTPSADKIAANAPNIDTIYLDTTWEITDHYVTYAESAVTVDAVQVEKKCSVYVANGAGVVTRSWAGNNKVTFNSLMMNGDAYIITAADTYNNKKFAYWEVYQASENGTKTNVLVTKYYYKDFGLRIVDDYYLVPVYEAALPPLTAEIGTPILNREIYDQGTTVSDNLYVDLMTAYTSQDVPVFKENDTDYQVECGVLVVRNNTTKLSDADFNTLMEAGKKGEADTTAAILQNYTVNAALAANLQEIALDSNIATKTNTVVTCGSEQYRVTKYIFEDQSKLTNKNRIDKVIQYSNTVNTQKNIYTAYAYAIIRTGDGQLKEFVVQADGQYYNFCYLGNTNK